MQILYSGICDLLQLLSEVFLAIGPEEFLLREHLETLKKASLEKYGEFSVEHLSLADHPLSALKNEVFSPPFFGGKRVLFISGFPPPASPALSEEKRNAYGKFVESLSDIPEGVVLIFSSAHPDKRTKIFKGLQKIAKKIWKFEAFDEKKEPHKYSEWIIERAKRYGVGIAKKEAEFLRHYSGGKLEVLHQEIKKLALFCAGRNITEEDIKTLSIPTHELADFGFSNAVSSGRFSRIHEEFQRLTENFDAGMLWNRDIISVFRTLLKVKAIERSGASAKDVGIHPFVASKMKNVASHISESDIQKLYKKLVQIDEKTKDGRLVLTGKTEPFFTELEVLLHDVFGKKS